MSTEANVTTTSDRETATALVDSWIALWNGDYDIAETIISESNRVHAAMLDGGDGSAVAGASGMKDFVRQTRSLSFDLVFSVGVGPLVDGDHVVVRWVATGSALLLSQLAPDDSVAVNQRSLRSRPG